MHALKFFFFLNKSYTAQDFTCFHMVRFRTSDNEIASDMTGLIFPARESLDNTTSVLQGGQFLGRETK
jgi:hypothetical protein